MKNKKIIFLIIFTSLLIIFVLLSNAVFGMFYTKARCNDCYIDFASKNPKVIFSIDKCVFFTNCNAKNMASSSTNFTLENLYQYTDIALFINNNSDVNSLENTLKSVKISNLKFSISPSIGKQSIFYKDINSFSKGIIPENNVFDDELVFSISSNDEEDLDTPTLYNNCANPIVLSYINENIKSDYTITDTSIPITYDGSLLKRCGVLLSELNAKFSFDIFITNNLDQEFKCTVYIEPPLEYDSKSLYDGAITVTQHTNYKFYRYK